MGKAINTCCDNLGYFNPPNVYRPAIIDIRIVGEYSAEDGATNTYRITQNDGRVFEFDVKNGSGGSAGRSVTSVEQIQISTESLGKNIARINLSDGTYTDVEIRNGAQGKPGPRGNRGPAGIDSVEASIGTNDPTQAPSVEKELSEGVLSLTFNNIKGEKGDQGEPAVSVENYVTAEATSSTTSATDVLPATGSSDTVYRVSNWDGAQYNTNAYTEYGWYDGAYKMLATRTPGIDDEPTAGSQKLVKSGGVAAQISQLGQQVIYDVTANNDDAKFASLSALLSSENLSTLIPSAVRCGGMSIRFVQSSDNKYVQYRLTADEFTTDTTQWNITDEGVYVDNPEFVYVKTDRKDKILWAIKIDGDIYYGAGCPQQVKDYIEEKLSSLSLDEYEDIVAFLSDYLGSDTTLKAIIDEINERTPEVIENPEYIQVTTDSESKILEAITTEGMKVQNLPVETPVSNTSYINNPEFIEVKTNHNDEIISYRDKKGKLHEEVGIDSPTINTLYIKNGYYPLVGGDFYSKMTKEQFVNTYNSKLEDFAKLCKCNAASFYELSASDDESIINWRINHNFRDEVVFDWMDRDLFMSQLNKYFKIPIYRFDDAKINNTDIADCSLRVLFNEEAVSRVNVEGYTESSFQCVKTGTQYPPITVNDNNTTVNNGWTAITYNGDYPLYISGESYSSGYTVMYEPSSLISDDGQKIELFGQTVYTESEDGVNWSSPVGLQFPQGHAVHGHSSVHKIDGVYMMIGCTSNNAATPSNIVYQDLWTSTDKIHWEWKGHLISSNDDIGSGETFCIMGNSYMFKDNGGVYYLYYEGARTSPYWETCLMTCTDLFYDRGNGFIGNWVQCSENPIFPYLSKDPLTGLTRVWCNPEFVKGQDNKPLKINGRYYMYYLTGHYEQNGVVQDHLNRMYSYDLVHWVEEGSMFDNRDVADGGEIKGDNGDQSMCEFKGRTYLFYTHNMNTYGYADANIRYTIDDRTQIELLKIEP